MTAVDRLTLRNPKHHSADTRQCVEFCASYVVSANTLNCCKSGLDK